MAHNTELETNLKKDFVILFFGERVELLCFMTITSVRQPFPFPHIWWRGRGEFKIKDSDRNFKNHFENIYFD